MYGQEKTAYNYDYIVIIRDRDTDEIVDKWQASMEVMSSKANPYEDFWKEATSMRKKYVKNNSNHSYYIEALDGTEEE